MDYQQIETFIVISEVRNLTRASHILYKTQPTISNRIQQLEDSLGYSLLVREKGRQEIELTERGKLFLEKAKKLYEDYENLYESSENIANTLMISSIASYQIPLICRVCEKMADKESVRFSLYTYQTADVYKMISDRKVDLAIASAAESMQSVTCEMLFTQTYYLVKPGNSSEMIRTIRIDELNPDYEIYQPWDDDFYYWHERVFHGNKPHIIVDSYAALKELFSSRKYWAILQESNVVALKKDMDIELYKIDNPPPIRKGYLLTNPFADRKVKPLIRKFRDVLLNTVEEFRIKA